MRRLIKAAKKHKTYKQFEVEVLKWLKHYRVPVYWTKIQLKQFYEGVQNG